jgi:diguanylate cyclase (GGDEF)-like protein
VAIATALAGAVRRNDTVARIGGDEFAILVEDAGSREAYLLAERLQNVLLEKGLAVSIGWSAWPDDALNAQVLFDRADQRLYASKTTERAGEPPESPGGRLSSSPLATG